MRKIISFLLGLVFIFPIFSQQQDKKENRPQSVFNTIVPEHLMDIILARPTANSITLSVLFYQNRDIKIEYGTSGKKILTPLINCIANEPKTIILNDLIPGSTYEYSLKTPSGKSLNTEPCYFNTQKSKSTPFSFTITADSHLDENADNQTYKQTLLNAAADAADFHFDLGDTFMTDKYRENYKNSLNQYLAQRYYLGLLCKSSPLFFVQGNHDGEAGQRLNGNINNMTVWSNLTRKKYFLNPEPDNFYSGNTDENEFCGRIQNYYAFEWGNALFVVLDPFWYTPRSGMENPWDRTLGKKQYDWLKNTLEKSSASFKFVFIHNLTGGVDIKGKARGGVEVAGFYEWGGKNQDGTEGFKTNRPDWEMPVHQLLVKNNVAAVFHGHDHIFAKQNLDGIVYQCLSQPGSKQAGNIRNGEEYGYQNGVILNAPGYMRVTIHKDKADCKFYETKADSGKTVLYEYLIKK